MFHNRFKIVSCCTFKKQLIVLDVGLFTWLVLKCNKNIAFIAKHLDHYTHYRLSDWIWRILKMPLLLVSSFKEKGHLVVEEYTTHRKFYTPWWIWWLRPCPCHSDVAIVDGRQTWYVQSEVEVLRILSSVRLQVFQIVSHSRWCFLIY